METITKEEFVRKLSDLIRKVTERKAKRFFEQYADEVWKNSNEKLHIKRAI